jgi:hypothetical protein
MKPVRNAQGIPAYINCLIHVVMSSAIGQLDCGNGREYAGLWNIVNFGQAVIERSRLPSTILWLLPGSLDLSCLLRCPLK